MTCKKLLTLEDLYVFCKTNKFKRFNASESGYKLSVQVPSTYEYESVVDDDHRGMIKLKFRIFHDGLNRNGSYISHEAAENAMSTIKNRPVLAAIHQLDDGSWDFEGHEMEIVTNEDGDKEVHYIEKQVGAFSSEEPFWEYDEELDKNYICAYAYIPEEYTEAANIIKNKNGTKNSCELCIESMSYDGRRKRLNLEEFYVMGSTLLGSHDDGTAIEEGMLGSRADIVDFSEKKNSVFNTNMVAMLNEINEKLNQLTIDNLRKEENQMNFDENAEVIETPEEETFEEEVASEDVVETTEAEESTEEVTEVEQDQEIEEVTPSEDEEKFSKQFEISHEDIRCALYALLSSYEDEDNEWYYITAVYDDNFIYEGMFNGTNKYRQNYTKDGDNIAFDGDRVHMNVEYLTDNELAALNAMRSNYEEMSAQLEKYEAEPEKIEVLQSEAYAQIKDTEEYCELAKRETYFDMSKEDLSNKLDEILLSYAKQNKIEFSASSENSQGVTMKRVLTIEPKVGNGRYGSLFSK